MGERLPDQRIDSHVVLHVTVIVEDAVLTVSGEGIERDVGDDPKLRETRAQGAGGALGDAIGIPGLGRV